MSSVYLLAVEHIEQVALTLVSVGCQSRSAHI